MVRKLAAQLGGRAVLSMLSSILEDEQDLPFAAALVQALNLILLTAPEVGCPRVPWEHKDLKLQKASILYTYEPSMAVGSWFRLL